MSRKVEPVLGCSRPFRLVSKQEFQFVFAKPRKVLNKYLIALYRPNQRACARLGLIISKALCRRAIDRNRLRRVIRESFRHHKEALKGLDIVVLLRSKWGTKDKLALRDDVDKLWQLLAN